MSFVLVLLLVLNTPDVGILTLLCGYSIPSKMGYLIYVTLYNPFEKERIVVAHAKIGVQWSRGSLLVTY